MRLDNAAVLRFAIRVKPGASRPGVGGRFDGDVLVVSVAARAVDGAANRAVVDALAAAFAVRRAEVEIVAGATSRTKTVAIGGDEERLSARLVQLLDAPARRGQ
jgi:uncharacterized protein (TIGR00251 family)